MKKKSRNARKKAGGTPASSGRGKGGAPRTPGDRNWVGYGFDLHPEVSTASFLLVVLFVVGTLSYRTQANQFFQTVLTGITHHFGWFYILTANLIVLAMGAFALGRTGKVRLGGPDARPEFSDFAWYAMLISAGMGIGLMFWSIAEPLTHFQDPSPMFGVAGGSAEAAQAAFAVTYFHWGLHPWGIYALVGLALAFFTFNRGLPLTLRSAFHPLLGERIHGWWGNLVDILAVLATLCGLATSLGLGVQQVGSGLDFLFPLPQAVKSRPLAGTRTPGAPGHELLARSETIQVGSPVREIALEPGEAPALGTGDFLEREGGPSRVVFDAFRGVLTAPTTGTLGTLHVHPEDQVQVRQALVDLEDRTLYSVRDLQVVSWTASPGQRVVTGQELGRFQEGSPDAVLLGARWRKLYRAWSDCWRRARKLEGEPRQELVAEARAWRSHMRTIEKGIDSVPSRGFLVFLIAFITCCATLSVVAGLDAGVRRLSEINIYLAGSFMFFLLVVGPTTFILGSLVQNTGFYLQTLPQMATWTESYRDSSWQSSWTLFYWGWWISWSPFVGMFIARISRGRTVREFILGVALFPTLLSFLWMSVFGGTAVHLELGGVDLSTAVSNNVATALFEMLLHLPWTGLASMLGIALVVFFFVTSSDSGSLVVDHLVSGGKLDSPVPQRVFWAGMEGLLAAVLLLGGGLVALQTASITTGLPFALVLLVMIYSLGRGLAEELEGGEES